MTRYSTYKPWKPVRCCACGSTQRMFVQCVPCLMKSYFCWYIDGPSCFYQPWMLHIQSVPPYPEDHPDVIEMFKEMELQHGNTPDTVT